MLTKIVFIWAVFNPNTLDVQVQVVPAPSMEACERVAELGIAERNAAQHGYIVQDARCEVVEWKK